jgi:murein DD-endopeptidase MepM/ murein hydrolase activator NlpD
MPRAGGSERGRSGGGGGSARSSGSGTTRSSGTSAGTRSGAASTGSRAAVGTNIGNRTPGVPVAGRITSAYGTRTSPTTGATGTPHRGVDIRARVGTPVHATGAGTVTRAGWENAGNHAQGFGQRVTVNHGHGNTSTVGHLSRVDVTPGQRVQRGTVLGQSGNTGTSTGPHVHYEERRNGTAHRPTYNPSQYRARTTAPAPQRRTPSR